MTEAVDSPSGSAERPLSVALIAPPHGGAAIGAILAPPAFILSRIAPGGTARMGADPDVIVVDLSSVTDPSDPAAADLCRVAQESGQRLKAPLVLLAAPRVFPPDTAMSEGIRGYVSPADMHYTLAPGVRAVVARHRTDAELRRKEAQIQDLLKETDHALFAASAAGINLETSETELEMLGVASRDEILGKPMVETHWLRPAHYREFMERLVAQGHLKSYKMLFKKRGGREILWVQGNCRLERDAAGRPAQVRGIYRDVTLSYTQHVYQRALSRMAATRRGDDARDKPDSVFPPGDAAAPGGEAQARADEIPAVVCRTIHRTAVASAALFLVQDREADALVVQHAEGLADELRTRVEGATFPRDAFPAMTAPAVWLRRGGAPLIADLPAEGSEDALLCSLGSPAEANSFVLIIGGYMPAPGGEAMVRLTAFLAEAAHHLRMAVAVQKNRIYRASPNTAGALAGGRRRVDDFLSHLLRALRDEVYFEGGAIFRLVQGVAGMRKPKLRMAAATGVFDMPLKNEIELDDAADAPAGSLGNEERARRTERAFTAALKAHEPYHSGRKAWINVPIRSPDGSLVGILHAVGQGHARRTSAPMRFAPWDREIFKAAADQAELVVSLLSAEERRSALLAYVTHEIRAPVNTIRATLDVLQHRPHDDAQFRHKLAAIKLEAEILLDLAHKLDGFFGPPRVIPRDSDAVDCEPLLLAVVGQVEPDLRERGFSRSDVDVNLRQLPRIRMPSADLKQIFFNLFRNAVLYSDASSSPKFRVRVVSNMNRQRPAIYFRDWGVGIMEGDRERIFEPGVRGSNAQEVQVRGTGLGLAICRQLLGDHGGTIVVSNLHKPTEFTIEFPAHAVEQS